MGFKKDQKTYDKPVRENLVKLGQKITDRIGVKVTPDEPEYWGLDGILSDEMIDVANCMGVRKPVTLAQLAKKTKRDPAELEKLLADMAYVGIIEYNWENRLHEKQYVLPMFVPGSAEFTNMRPSQLEEHPELADFFENMSRLPLEKVTRMVPPGGAGIGMHVIPVESAIDNEAHSIDLEHITHWLKKYDGKYAASPCSCRYSRKTQGIGCGDDPEDWCIAVGDMADYIVETDRGRYISYDEALEIFDKAEKNGFVHQITNIDGENKIFGICNCNVNVCYALRTSQLFNTPNMSASAYRARVNPDNCVACGQCVEHCPAGAVKLGQKLCTKDGPVKFPKVDLPDALRWGPERWTENYRDVNRIECYDTGTAPCKTACPAHIGIQGYLELAKEGRYEDALELIKKDNPFPAVCGRICNKRCEDACTRGTVDEAISIDEVKNFLAQRDLDSKTRFIPKKIMPTNKPEGFSEKVAIIGAGPAGLSCAYYLALKGYRPTVFERNAVPGGMLVYGIPSFKLEKDVVAAEIDVLRELGVEIQCGVNIGTDITIPQLRDEGYKAFYVAIGCQGSRRAGVPGDDAKGVISAVDHLRLVGAGGYKVSGKVVVVGGGNVAIDAARTSGRIGAAEAAMYCLEQRGEMPAADNEIAEAEDENITINCGWGPKEFLTDGKGKVKGVVFKKCTSVKNAEGRFDPQYDENDTMTVEADYVVTSIGQCIDWGGLLEGSKMDYVHGNYPKADPHTYQTAEPDIFVGGDVYSGPKFVIDAIAAGRQGAESVHRYAQPRCTETIGRDWRELKELDKDNILLSEYDKTPRQQHGTDNRIDVRTSFRDARLPFTEEQVKAETGRCLKCGASVVDENKCIGCGVCTVNCRFDAIHLFREHPEASTMIRSEDKMKGILPYAAKRAIKIKKADLAEKLK